MKRFMAVAMVLSLLCLAGCGGGGGGGGGGDGDTFTNGGVTLTTAVATSAGSKTVTVTDSDGVTIVTLNVTTTGATLSAPGESDISMTFRQALDSLPTDYTARRMAMYVAGIRTANNSISAMPDSPGCDWFPDTQCTLGCCAEHDRCYADNNCGASSWLWGFGTDACDNCNDIVYDCIAAACAGVTESFTENNCYDARCNAYYDCPPEYNNCTCTDICTDEGVTVPSTCGDGQCVTGETLENCFNDCGFGTSVSQCCVNSGDCPSETPDTCPGTCCCCGIGYTCNPATHQCAPGDFL